MAKAPISRTEERQASVINFMQFFNNRVRVYPKAVHGPARNFKWFVLIGCLSLYYILPWIRWDRGPDFPNQAVLLDLPNRRFYFAWLELWPQDIYVLEAILIFAAFFLFLLSSVVGRVWCGYTCPQTVWTDLFMWVERRIEGDRNERMRRDQGPASFDKTCRKIAKHTAWVFIAFLTGGAWIMYFVNAPTVTVEFWTGQASSAVYFFTGLFTLTTYLLGGWAREQVCTYMCPWPRFQSAMLDEHTLTVTYQKWRGEPRGHGKRDGGNQDLGNCVDCSACVQACPTGIDIRDGIQLECINCGLCVDACNEIMDRTHQPKWLITWDTLARQNAKAKGEPAGVRLLRPRTIIYATLLVLVAAGGVIGMVLRPHQELFVQHDRAPLFMTEANGAIRNGYNVVISNKTQVPAEFVLTLAGLDGAVMRLPEGGTAAAATWPATAVFAYRAQLTISPAKSAVFACSGSGRARLN